LISGTQEKKGVTNLGFNDFHVDLIALSTQGIVDLYLKDFAKIYEHTLTVYQNDIGFFEKVIFNFT
jgi:hypothetical protein